MTIHCANQHIKRMAQNSFGDMNLTEHVSTLKKPGFVSPPCMGVKAQVTGVEVPMPRTYTFLELVRQLSESPGVDAVRVQMSHLLLCRYWVKAIARKGLTGVAKSQLPEYVAPHGTTEAIFGISPVAVGLPTAAGDVSIGEALTRCKSKC